MRANRLAGHILPNEGRIFGNGIAYPKAEGRAECSCGATSEVLPSAGARRKWHRDEHKEQVREHGFDDRAAYPASAEQVAGLLAIIEAEVAWQRQMYGNSTDPADTLARGRLIGVEDTLRMVRRHLTPKGPNQ